MESPPRAKFTRFDDFYPFYLSEHSASGTKQAHFLGSCLVFATFVTIVITHDWGRIYLVPFFGYGSTWASHFFIEKNRPASFRQPLYSLRADALLFFHLLSGRLSFKSGAVL
ncbi:MAG: DUF962 domain-containing protein [Cryobacterium sp.]|nr:DUF962 domain-containing protein [Oligoflexia bacterium]